MAGKLSVILQTIGITNVSNDFEKLRKFFVAKIIIVADSKHENLSHEKFPSS